MLETEWFLVGYVRLTIRTINNSDFGTFPRPHVQMEIQGIVKQTRSTGKAQMYHYNTQNHIAETLDDLAFEVAKHENDKTLRKEDIPRIPV